MQVPTECLASARAADLGVIFTDVSLYHISCAEPSTTKQLVENESNFWPLIDMILYSNIVIYH